MLSSLGVSQHSHRISQFTIKSIIRYKLVEAPSYTEQWRYTLYLRGVGEARQLLINDTPHATNTQHGRSTGEPPEFSITLTIFDLQSLSSELNT
jgi:hypothetical protein